MAASGLNMNSILKCPHGGSVQQVTLNSCVKTSGDAWSLQNDIDLISGCPQPTPCTKVQWLFGSLKVKVRGQPVLTKGSVGLCISANGPTGNVQVVQTQGKVDAQ